jgi:hypothetical protein
MSKRRAAGVRERAQLKDRHMSMEPQKDEASPIRKLTPEEEKKGVRTLGFVLLGFFTLMAVIIGMAGRW